MTSKELIKKVITFDNPKRIGFNFNSPYPSDILWISIAKFKNKPFHKWGRHEELLKKVPSFSGDVYQDPFGNILGRLKQKTNGEIIYGALEESWDLLDTYKFPEMDFEYEKECKKTIEENKDKFVLAVLPVSPFGTLRKLRKLENFLMDTVLHKDEVKKLSAIVMNKIVKFIEYSAQMGADGVCIYDDWGTQERLLISPNSWRELFKPMYAKMSEKAHENDIAFFMHSCGYIYEIVDDLIEIGLDVIQLDQPELFGVENLAKKFGGRVAFWSPVDIQKIMQTKDKKIIQEEARKMINEFGKFNGGFIAKDYPQWEEIDIADEWAQWAREVFLKEGYY